MQHFLKMIALLALIGAGNAQAQDIEKGHELVHENCVSCHHNEVYTRADRRVTSLAGLHKQVRRCEQNLGLTWFDEDIHNVSGYLNNKYYKFENK